MENRQKFDASSKAARVPPREGGPIPAPLLPHLRLNRPQNSP